MSDFEPNYGQAENRECEAPWPELPTIPSPLDTKDLFALSYVETNWQTPLAIDSLIPNNEYNTIIARPYLTRNIVQLKQKRRMRSKELHYIDHPQVGLLIKLMPYERPTEILEDTPTGDEEAKLNTLVSAGH